MEQCSHHLLGQSRLESSGLDAGGKGRGGSCGGSFTSRYSSRTSAFVGRIFVGGRGDETAMMGEDHTIVFSSETAKKLEHHHEEDDSDAGTGEHAIGSDMPAFGDETCIQSDKPPCVSKSVTSSHLSQGHLDCRNAQCF